VSLLLDLNLKPVYLSLMKKQTSGTLSFMVEPVAMLIWWDIDTKQYNLTLLHPCKSSSEADVPGSDGFHFGAAKIYASFKSFQNSIIVKYLPVSRKFPV